MKNKINWDDIRKDFEVSKNKIFFLSAGMSPLPKITYQAIIDEYDKLHKYGEINWVKDFERYTNLCKDIAALINTRPENITFVQSTSLAMSIIALSLKNYYKSDFNIVSMQDEFPSSTVPYEYQGIEMRYVQPIKARYSIDSIMNLINEKTIAVVSSHVQYSTGFKQDILSLGKLLKEKNILFIVNATQAFPYYPVDVEAAGISALTASVHKWGLCGHIGCLFYTSEEFRRKFPSPIAGWLSIDTQGKGFIHTDKNIPFKLHDSAYRYTLGSFNIQTILAFQKALDYIKKIGIENIQERLSELTDYLIKKLKKLNVNIVTPTENKNERAAIVSFDLGSNEKNEEFVKECYAKDIIITQRNGLIRVSVNIFINYEDIDKLISLLNIFLSK
jgi:selenocysteine lyase/cysteine desulfurase